MSDTGSLRPPMFTPFNAPMRMEAGQERLAQPYSRVTLKNTGAQTHVVIDRHQQGVELRGGETKHDIEMLNDEIAHLQRQRIPDRMYNPDGKGLRAKPLHPIVVEGVGDMITAADKAEREKWEQAERMKKAEARQFLKHQLSMLDDPDALPSMRDINGKP